MKKRLIAIAVALAVAGPVSAMAADSGGSTFNAFGYGQITGSQQFNTPGNSNNGMIFGAHRIRLGFKGEAIPDISYFFQYRWDGFYANKGAGTSGSSSVHDAYLNFAYVPTAQVQAGKFRVPVGLERTQVGGSGLWFIQRSMNQSLGANRGVGLMLHSDKLLNSSVYYDIGMFNNISSEGNSAFGFGSPGLTSPASSTGQSSVGGIATNGSGHYLWAAMVGYRMNPFLNLEVSGARASAKGVAPYSNAVDASNIGVNGKVMGLNYMAEYSRDTNYAGIEGETAHDWYVALTANLRQMGVTQDSMDIEPAVRYESYRMKSASLDSDLGNTTLGVNYYFDSSKPAAAKLQLNYVIPNNTSAWTVSNAPVNAYIYKTLVLQMQVGFF